MSTSPSSVSSVSWLLSRTRGVRPMWLVSTLARITNQLLLIAVLVCAGKAILDVSLTPWIWWILVLSVVKAGLRYLEHFAGHWVAFTVLTRMRTEFYDSLVPQAPAIAKGSGAAELSERATKDIDRVEVFFAHTVPPAVAAVVVPLVTVVWCWMVLGARPALIILVASVFMVGFPALSRKVSWRSVEEVGAANARIAIHLGDSILGGREISVFGARTRRIAKEQDLEDGAEKPRTRIRLVAGLRATLLTVIELTTLALLVAVPLGTDVVVPVISALVWVGLWAPLRGVDDFVDGLDEALESTERIRRTVDATPVVTETNHPIATSKDPDADGSLILDGVSFRYPGLADSAGGEEQTVKDISLRVTHGSWSYIAGVSGSGKSTLAALIARGYDPDAGVITLDGTNIKGMSLAELRSRVALVVQRPYLLHATLAANLRLSAPQAAEQDLWDVLRAVDLEEWAASVGLEQEIAADGANLSGGQVQRVAIARALLIRPELLILDEATSQMDESTAKRVREGIREFAPEMTILEISHQVDRIPSSSTVSIIDNGELIEQGKVGELLTEAASYLTRLAAR